MKRIISILLAIFIVLSCAGMLFACGENEDIGNNNSNHVCPSPELTEGENGNWWLGGEDTGIPVTAPAPQIVSTETAIINSAGVDYCVITITFSDGSTKEVIVEMPKKEDNFIPTATITNGYGGTNGIVCLMTDNDSGKFETLALLDKLYIEYGLVGGLGTVVKNLYTDKNYTSPKTADVKKWQEFLDTGRWQIINHSMTHTTYCDFINGERVVNEERLYNEIVRSSELLRQLFPGERVLTYAMTGTQSALGNNASSDPDNIRECERELIAEYYIGGRFKATGAVAYEDLQWNNLPYMLLSRSNLSFILNNIDKAANEGKFFMVYNHYVIEDEFFDTVNESSWTNKSTAIALCERVAQYVNDGSVWNAHFEDAIMYMRERETATLSATYDSGKIKVNLTDEMDDTIYNHKLTVKLSVPEGWAAVRIIQGSEVSYAKVTEEFGEYYALVNILPDGGEATIEKASPSDIPEEKPEEIKPTPDITDPNAPTTPLITTVPDVYTFDTLDGYLGGIITFNSYDVPTNKLSIVTDGDNKVLKMEKPEGDKNPIVTMKGNNTSGSKSLVFETKLKLEHTSSSGEVYLSFAGKGGAYAYRIFISFNSDGTVNISDYRSDDSARATTSKVGMVGKWLDLKLIYTVSENKATVTVFVNGAEVLKSNNHYLATQAPMAADTINSVSINFSRGYLGNTYLDNLSLKGEK